MTKTAPTTAAKPMKEKKTKEPKEKKPKEKAPAPEGEKDAAAKIGPNIAIGRKLSPPRQGDPRGLTEGKEAAKS